MNSPSMASRLQAKTPEQKLMQLLTEQYRFAPKVAEALVSEARESLLGQATQLQPGQVRCLVAAERAPVGRPLVETALTEVVWTVDAGPEDRQVLIEHGRAALRRVRICRLLDEAREQGALATQEDLAGVLHVSVRTIKRDWAVLIAGQTALPSRGSLKGVGRGQTHKAQILGRWLAGETYDQIALHTRHSPSAIQRYVHAFCQVVQLQEQGYAPGDIARLLQVSLSLVAQYQQIYAEQATPACRERLTSQLQRFAQATPAKKGGR